MHSVTIYLILESLELAIVECFSSCEQSTHHVTSRMSGSIELSFRETGVQDPTDGVRRGGWVTLKGGEDLDRWLH